MLNRFPLKKPRKPILMLACMCLAAGLLIFAGNTRAEAAAGAKTQTAAAPKVAEEMPEIISLKLSADGSRDKADIQWNSVEGREYRIMRKVPGGDWTTVGGVKASGTTAKYTDTGLNPNKVFIYTIRSRAKKKNGSYQYSLYDKQGITTIPGKVELSLTVENLSTSVSWNSLDGSGVSGIKYVVYRGFLDSSLRSLATVKDTVYVDVYHKTFNEAEQAAYMHSSNNLYDRYFSGSDPLFRASA